MRTERDGKILDVQMKPQEVSSWLLCFETKHAVVQQPSLWYPGVITELFRHLPTVGVTQTPSENRALPCIP